MATFLQWPFFSNLLVIDFTQLTSGSRSIIGRLFGVVKNFFSRIKVTGTLYSMQAMDFSLVFNSLKSHALIIGTDYEVIAATDGILKATGLKRENIVGKKVTDLFSHGREEDLNEFYVSVRYALEKRTLYDMGTTQWKSLENETTYWNAKTYPVFDANDEVSYLVHEAFEITNEIKKDKILNVVEKELLQQTTLSDILDRQSDGFFIINRQETFTYANKFMKDFGLLLNISQIVGSKVLDVFRSKDTLKFLARYRRIMESKVADHFIETLDDRYLSVDAYPTLEGGVAVFFRDVTQRVETEKEILLGRAKLEIIANQIPAFVAYFDDQGHYQFANKTYEEWFELKQDQIIGKKREDFASHLTSTIAKEHEIRALRGETIKYQNVLHKGDKTIYLDVSYVPDFDKKTGKVQGAVVIGYDVTEQVLAKLEMEKALKLREDFMSIASHELKTPITSMYLQNQILRRLSSRDELMKEDVERFLKSSDGNIKRLDRLIDDMLDITKIDNGKLSLQTEVFDLGNLIQEIIERYSLQFHKISFSSNGSVKGKWDRVRIDQVISNLITNSIKYGDQSPITVTLEQSHDEAIITVRDEGPGIAKENQKRIFQRFERESGQINASGLGLGLYICKDIVERHQGRISVDSEPGKGAEFKVALPLA